MNFSAYILLFSLLFLPFFIFFLFVSIIVINFVFFYFWFPLLSRPGPGRRILYVYIIRVSVQCSLHFDTARWQLYDNDDDDDEQTPRVPAHQKNTWQFNDSDSPTLYMLGTTTTTPSLLWLLYYYRCHVYLTTMTLTIFYSVQW